ncbi:MAG: glycosyltransferase [Thermoanaerobaculia bacterium]
MHFSPDLSELPFVDVVVPVHDEAAHMAEKIENLRALDYPPGRIAFWIVDGDSKDATGPIAEAAAAGDPRFAILRLGVADKARQLNLAFPRCRGEWILVTDADSRLGTETLRELVRDGEAAPPAGTVGATVVPVRPHPWEALHWRASDEIRLREAAVGSASIVTGPCYLVRRGLIDRFPAGVVADDVYAAFRTAAAGFRTGFIAADVIELRTPESLRELISHKYRKARAYIREIFRFLPFAAGMRGPARRHFVRHAIQMVVVPPLAAAVALFAVPAILAFPGPTTRAALAAGLAACLAAFSSEWRRRAGLAVLLTGVLLAAAVSLAFVPRRPPYRKVDARRTPVPGVEGA